MVYKFLEYRYLDFCTIDFIEESINEREFVNYLNISLKNESLVEDLKGLLNSFKEKVQDIFYTFLVKAYEIGFDIFNKLSIFLKWLIGTIKKFQTQNPVLYKIILITTITMIVLIVTSASAHAQNNGQQIPISKINMAIGWLDYIKQDGSQDSLELNKAIAHLIDIRDGKIDMPNLGQKATQTADAALRTVDKIIQQEKTQAQDDKFYRFCVSLIEKGQSYIQAIYSKSHGQESIKLLSK